VLSAADVRLLDGLTLAAGVGEIMPSAAGLRRARARGAGIEFHEYRHYEPGDDPRSIDWTVEARLDQLVVRVSRAEGELRLHVLIDVSRSMSVGAPDKLSCAARVAAALGYVAVERRDLVGLATFDDNVATCTPPAAGRTQLFRLLALLQSLRIAGTSDIDRALLQYGAGVRGPGIVAVISDFLQTGAGLQGLRYLLHRGLTPAVIQMTADEEWNPAFEDAVELIDVEAPDSKIVVDPSMIRSYRQRLDAHCGELRTFCLSHGLVFVQVDAAASFNTLVANLKTAGVFRAAV
jgi:uncharacterized protein (DUF58 family)